MIWVLAIALIGTQVKSPFDCPNDTHPYFKGDNTIHCVPNDEPNPILPAEYNHYPACPADYAGEPMPCDSVA